MSEQINELKSRLLDSLDAVAKLTAHNNDLSGALTEIAQVTGVSGTDGTIKLEDIVNVVKALVADAEPAEVVE